MLALEPAQLLGWDPLRHPGRRVPAWQGHRQLQLGLVFFRVPPGGGKTRRPEARDIVEGQGLHARPGPPWARGPSPFWTPLESGIPQQRHWVTWSLGPGGLGSSPDCVPHWLYNSGKSGEPFCSSVSPSAKWGWGHSHTPHRDIDMTKRCHICHGRRIRHYHILCLKCLLQKCFQLSI